MNEARVVTNETCNQACAFCSARRPNERREIASAHLVLARVDEAKRAGARTIAFTGGEPTLRRDLPLLVERASEGGAVVVLETNAALVDDARAHALRARGLARARVHLPAWGEALDAITRDPGGFLRTLEGLRALVRASVAIEASAPVVASNEASISELPRHLRASGLPFEGLELAFVVESPEPGELLSLARQVAIATRVAEAARTVGIRLSIAPHVVAPPCLFERPSRVAHLFRLTPGGRERDDHARVDVCASCALVDRCPGFPRPALAREGDELRRRARPIHDDAIRRRLSLVGTIDEQIRRELVTRDVRRGDGGELIPEAIVRVIFHCNQDCRFCFVSTHLPAGDDARIEAEIKAIGSERGILTLSGGEPTLSPRLLDWVKLGRASGAREIELQTNATRLGDDDLAADLAEAGVSTFFVSLHAPRADVSDAITAAPGTFDATVRGLDAIAKTGATLRLNFVTCAANAALFPEHVRFVAARWPHAELAVSFVAASTDVVPREASLVPRYSDVLPHLAEGARIARELGLVITGFESMCGLPLCLAPDDLRRYARLADVPEGLDRGEFFKPEACTQCSIEAKCFGIRRGYAELHGVDELRPR